MLFGFDDPVAEDARARSEAADSSHDMPRVAIDRIQLSPWVFGLVGLLVGLLLAAGIWLVWPDTGQHVSAGDLDQAVAEAFDARAVAPSNASVAYAQIAPSLVVVRAIGADEAAPMNIGAGVVINEQGQILTSHHVVFDASKIELRFADGSTSSAELQSSDTGLDIAVLTATNTTGVRVPAVMGNARTLQIGDPVFAVGNPLGLTASITAGVISGLNRDIPLPSKDGPSTDDSDAASEKMLEDLIQFDAAVNQGSSGGPLINADGHVIGIVTALVHPGGQGLFVGIGFAVPIDSAAQRAADGLSQ